ncbi:tail protein (tape measure) [Obesumbacterium proteus]|uniref:phage tail length tape measure family protein n=1 Tax=Obesumbacterium proteus TaxID=82983 RepID=UPI000621B43B|nr:phage tail length tape measure family protein [Obesumbacterium proteus]KKI48984.1 tail protein (tape measure) [Obesumbacterium proteus]
MAGEKSTGSIVYEISADVEPLLQGGKQAIDALDKLDVAARQSGKGMDNLDQSASQTGSAFTELAGYANSMDNQLRKLNTNVSGIARAMEEARSGTGGASSEFSRAESILESLGNQLAVLDEAQENGARSAAVLAAQLRAGSKASDEEKQKIGELTGRLFDMKTGVETGSKSHGKWKTSMQQAGYQVQDFIVQVQGGQSALVAFSQQGSQLAGAFGPGGAVIGAVIALSTVIAGTLITSLNGGKNAMDALKDAAEAMDKVITVSQNGVAALSDKYAYLAKTNAEVATLMRNQALLEYNEAINKIPKAISDASSSLLSFGDKALSAFSGGYASVDGFNDRLSALNITTNDYSQAMKQAFGAGQAFNATTMSIGNTVGAVADKFGISEQKAFEFSKQLSDIAKNPTPEALQRLAAELQNTQSSTEKGQTALTAFIGTLVNLSREAVTAKGNVAALKQETDNLTSGQKNLIKQSERNLALSKLQGEARARLQAQYAAEDAGFAKDDPHAKQMEDDAAATYKNTQAQKTLQSEHKKGASQADSSAQKLANLKQQSELAAGSTNELSREQALLRAEQSLGSSATQAQIKEAREYAAKTWDVTNALKMRQQAEQASRFINQEVSAAKVQRDPYTGDAEDPYASVDNEESKKLEALKNYQNLGVLSVQQFEDGKTAIARQAANERIKIFQNEQQRQVDTMNTLLGGIGDGFSGLAEIVSKSAGDSSAAYKALFAISKGFAVAQAGLNLQLAISNAMASGPFPWNMTAMAQVAATGGQLISSIGGVSYGGGREHGGPVSANSMYRVGEGGKPEIYQASNGSQYMIPGDNGRVISNRDMQGGGSGGASIQQEIHFHIETTGGIDDATMAKMSQMMKQVTLFHISDQANRPGGLIQPRTKR